MTDTSSTPETEDGFAIVMRQIADHQRHLAGLRDANKIVLFDALERASIARVMVSFDGYGDSGQIETIDADNREGRQVLLPDASVIYQRRTYGEEQVEGLTQTVCEAVEAMVYDCLAETHPGWENNDGADGNFTFDVATRTITLEHNQRFTDITSYEHEF